MKHIVLIFIITASCSVPGENFLEKEYPNPVVFIPDYVVSVEYKNSEGTTSLLPEDFFDEIHKTIIPYYHSELSRADATLLYARVSEQIIIRDITFQLGDVIKYRYPAKPVNPIKDPTTRMCLKRLGENRFKILYYYHSFRCEYYYVEKLVVFNNNQMAISDLQSWKVKYEYP